MGAGTSASTRLPQGATGEVSINALTGTANQFELGLKYRGSIDVNYSDGTHLYAYSGFTGSNKTFNKTYSATGKYLLKFRGDINLIDEINGLSNSGGNNNVYPGFKMLESETAKLKSLTRVNIASNNWNVIFDVTKLNRGMTYYSNKGINESFGSLNNLPPTLTVFNSSSSQAVHTLTLGPNILPAGLLYLYTYLGTVINGDIKWLPQNMQTFYNLNYTSAVTGDIAELPATMTNFTMFGKVNGTPPFQTITGNIKNIKPALLSLQVFGQNTITCNFCKI
jgi:hypothetical protein